MTSWYAIIAGNASNLLMGRIEMQTLTPEQYNKKTPFEQGYHDAIRGYAREDCPYTIDEDGYQYWLNGYDAGKQWN